MGVFTKLWRRMRAPAAPVAAPAVPAVSEADPFAVLRLHDVIAWDLDDTLIGHPASRALAAFILAEPQRRHLIVTFRPGRGRDAVWRDLVGTGLGPAQFASVEMTDDALFDTAGRLRRARAGGLFAGPATGAERDYLAFKGAACARVGATVLIDDRTEDVRSGCEMHGILFLHPDAFTGAHAIRMA